MKKLFSNFKIVLLDFLAHSKIFFKNVFGNIKSLSAKKEPYILISLFILTIAMASAGFYNNSYNYLWSYAMDVPATIRSNNYSSFLIKTSEIYVDNLSRKTQMIEFGKMLNNEYQYNSFSFLVPTEENKEIPFNVLFNNLSIGSATTADFFQYYSESYTSGRFSAIQLGRYDNSYEGILFNSYPFEGKDASSFIPTSLADKIIELFPNLSSDDQNDKYGNLLGSRYKVEYGGQSYNFSINNIYYENTYFGSQISKALNTPIITNCSSLFSTFKTSLVTGLIIDGITLTEILKSYSKIVTDDFFITTNFVDNYGYRIKYVNEEGINQMLYALNKDSSIAFSGSNIPCTILFFIFCTLQAIFLFVSYAKRKFDSLNQVILLCAILFVLYFIFNMILSFVFWNNICFYYLCNFGVGVGGICIPIILGSLIIAFDSIKKKWNKQ